MVETQLRGAKKQKKKKKKKKKMEKGLQIVKNWKAPGPDGLHLYLAMNE